MYFERTGRAPVPASTPPTPSQKLPWARGQPRRQPPAGCASCSLSCLSARISVGDSIRPGWAALDGCGARVPGSSGPSQPIAPGLHQALLVLITSPSPDRLPPRWVLDFSILRGLLGPNHQIKLCPDVLDSQRSDSPLPGPQRPGMLPLHRHTLSPTHPPAGSQTHPFTHTRIDNTNTHTQGSSEVTRDPALLQP